MDSLRLHSIIGIYHIVVLIVFSFHLCIQLTRDERFWQILYRGSSFLTIWNFIGVVSVFYGYLIHDVVNVFGWCPKLNRRFKIFVDYCFYSFIAPISIFITVIFWSIWNYDKNLVFGFGGLLEVLMPLWLSHIFHTFISFLVLLQTYHNKVYFKIRYLFGGCFIYAVAYYAWIEINHIIFDGWPYPLLEKLTTLQRHLLNNFLMGLAFCFFIVYNYLNRKYCLRYAKTVSFSSHKFQDAEPRNQGASERSI